MDVDSGMGAEQSELRGRGEEWAANNTTAFRGHGTSNKSESKVNKGPVQ